MIGEIIGGVVSGSLALLTDAAHQFSDILGFVISIISLVITRRRATETMSYGYHRAEVLGALISIAIIWALTIYLVSEAIVRIVDPTEVDGEIMLILACVGLTGNILMGLCLESDLSSNKTDEEEGEKVNAKAENDGTTSALNGGDGSPQEGQKLKESKSLNIKAALYHVLGDAIQSFGVVIAGIIIYFKPEYSIVDPCCTLTFAVLVFLTTYPVVKDCVRVLMEGTPDGLDIKEISDDLQTIDEISDLHDVHFWSLNPDKLTMSCHVITDNPFVALDKATKMLQDKYGISHVTIQTESPEEGVRFECKNEVH